MLNTCMMSVKYIMVSRLMRGMTEERPAAMNSRATFQKNVSDALRHKP